MIHTIRFVAESQSLHPESLINFAETHRGAFREHGELLTSTMLVDELLADFKAKHCLAAVPLHKLRIGDQLISAKGNSGRITSIDPEGHRDGALINMLWDTPQGETFSSQPLAYLDNVVYIGQPVKSE